MPVGGDQVSEAKQMRAISNGNFGRKHGFTAMVHQNGIDDDGTGDVLQRLGDGMDEVDSANKPLRLMPSAP